MKNELSTATQAAEQKINMPALPESFSEENLKKLFKQVEDEVKNEVPDVETTEGRKRIKELALKINKSKDVVDKPMRDYLRILKAQPKVLEKLARDSKANYENLRERVLEPLLEAQGFQDNFLEWLNSVPMFCASPTITSTLLNDYLKSINEFDKSTIWPELQKKFNVAIEAATTSATVTLERVEAAEKQAAELEELRRKQAEAEQAERDRKIAEEAAARAQRIAEEKAQREREDVERRAVEAKQREEEAKQAEAKARRDAELAEQRRKDEAEAADRRAEQEKIESQKRAEAAAKKAAEDERRRIEEEEAEQKRLAEAHEADKNHRIKINRAALVALVAGGLSEEDAKLAITMIAKKQVPNIYVAY
jgi:hypothetical protein